MNLREQQNIILNEFISFLEDKKPQERLWLLNNFHNHFCDQCGEDIADCLCIDEIGNGM